MSKIGIALAGLAAALGFGLGHVSGAWGFEQGWTYVLLSDSLLLVAVFVTMNRMMSRTANDKGTGMLILLIMALFGASILAASIGSGASDSSSARYLIVAAAFVPLAAVKRSAHQRWNVFAPSLVLILAPALTSVALAVAGGIEVRMEPIVFLFATSVVGLLSGSMPAISEKRLGQFEAGLMIIAAFLTGMTAVSGSYDYDGRAAALIGIIMVIVGWFVGVMLRRWEYAPSRALNWQNLVIGVWIGQFMPGASVMAAVALVVGWALYGTMQGISGSIRKARLRRQTVSN